ncbi:MAG: acetyl-CoA carboxylase, carboxyltransferase subunit beta [Clostridiales bacterium]|nr:acetyl-CoA carboxylase, carboxyltransferase subunit beta [Clostridiales bacterium]
MTIACPDCKAQMTTAELASALYVCARCGRHFRMRPRQRLHMLCDGPFEEMDVDLTSDDPLSFPEYKGKLDSARLDSNEREGVLTGVADVGGARTAIFAMDPYFMMGSMGTAVGEKVTRLFERALTDRLPVLGLVVSGGARIQEGILSLMQMAKTSAAVRRHSDAGLLYIAVLTDPTTGGVMASFAMEADVTLAEPGALIGFAGPRVIEQTIRQKLPEGFQRAEFLLKKGFVDLIVDRREQKQTIAQLFRLHKLEGA